MTALPITSLFFYLKDDNRGIVVLRVAFCFGASDDAVGDFLRGKVCNRAVAQKLRKKRTVIPVLRYAIAHHNDDISVLAGDAQLLSVKALKNTYREARRGELENVFTS